MYPLTAPFPPSPSAYVIDPMSPTATFAPVSHNFPSLFASNFALPPSALRELSDGISLPPHAFVEHDGGMPPLDDELSLASMLASSPIRQPSCASVSDSSESSSVSGALSPLHSPFILPPADSSASPSFDSSSTSSVSPPPGKRRRVTPLTKEQRAAINKAKHKEIDAARRQREATVVKQLQRLTRQKHEREEYSTEDEQQAQSEVDDEDEVEEGRRDKVTVLEESATTIAQLRALCRRMRRACNAKDRSITTLQKHLNAIAIAKSQSLRTSKSAALDPTSALSDPAASTASLLSFLPESTSHYLSQLDRSHALYTSTFVRSPLALVLIAIPSGIALDVNEVFERSTGWKRPDIVGTLIGPPADGSRPKHPLNPMVLRRRKDGKTQLRDGEDETDGWWVRRYLRQYPSSKLSMKEVWRGESKKVEVVWRVVLADGTIYEYDTHTHTPQHEHRHHRHSHTLTCCYCVCISQDYVHDMVG